MSRYNNDDYPTQICDDCGTSYGNWYKKGYYIGPPHHCATYYNGTCDLCKADNVPVTEPRDYGHLRAKWKAEIMKRNNV